MLDVQPADRCFDLRNSPGLCFVVDDYPSYEAIKSVHCPWSWDLADRWTCPNPHGNASNCQFRFPLASTVEQSSTQPVTFRSNREGWSWAQPPPFLLEIDTEHLSITTGSVPADLAGSCSETATALSEVGRISRGRVPVWRGSPTNSPDAASPDRAACSCRVRTDPPAAPTRSRRCDRSG